MTVAKIKINYIHLSWYYVINYDEDKNSHCSRR